MDSKQTDSHIGNEEDFVGFTTAKIAFPNLPVDGKFIASAEEDQHEHGDAKEKLECDECPPDVTEIAIESLSAGDENAESLMMELDELRDQKSKATLKRTRPDPSTFAKPRSNNKQESENEREEGEAPAKKRAVPAQYIHPQSVKPYVSPVVRNNSPDNLTNNNNNSIASNNNNHSPPKRLIASPLPSAPKAFMSPVPSSPSPSQSIAKPATPSSGLKKTHTPLKRGTANSNSHTSFKSPRKAEVPVPAPTTPTPLTANPFTNTNTNSSNNSPPNNQPLALPLLTNFTPTKTISTASIAPNSTPINNQILSSPVSVPNSGATTMVRNSHETLDPPRSPLQHFPLAANFVKKPLLKLPQSAAPMK